MYDPKSRKDTGDVKPAPYADAAVNDEDLTLPEDDTDPADVQPEADDLFGEEDYINVENPAEGFNIEEIEIEDIDDLDEGEEDEDFVE